MVAIRQRRSKMPYGLPAAITLSRYELCYDLDRKSEDGTPEAITVPEGTVVFPQYKQANSSEWLVTLKGGKRLSILEEKLKLSL